MSASNDFGWPVTRRKHGLIEQIPGSCYLGNLWLAVGSLAAERRPAWEGLTAVART